MLSTIQPSLLVKVRAPEKMKRRIISSRLVIFFNEICLQESLSSKCTKIWAWTFFTDVQKIYKYEKITN